MRQPCYLPGYVNMEYVQGKFSLFDSLSNFLEKSKSSVLFLFLPSWGGSMIVKIMDKLQ